jgi:hypothetical protein
MARINSYPKDIDIQDKDAWIGTDSYNRQTRQYTAEAVAKYLNIKGKVSIGGQMNYQFVDTARDKSGSMAFDAGGGDGTLFSAIQELTISIRDLEGQTVTAFMSYLVGEEILISDQADIQMFGHYRIDSYIVDTVNAGFYTLTIAFLGGNGNIYKDHYYDVVNFSLPASAADKTFTFVQAVPAMVWNITHTLDKFPSISVIDSGDTIVNGSYTYIDDNNITLNFSAPFAGKAYLN